MQVIKKLFNKPKPLEKFFEASSLFKINYVMKNEDVDLLISLLTEGNGHNLEDFFSYLNQNAQTYSVYTVRMKVMITLHQVVQHFQIGSSFSSLLIDKKIAIFSQNNDPKPVGQNSSTADKWLLENIQLPFFWYLKKVALNVEQFQQYRKYNFSQRINADCMVDCFRLQNISLAGLAIVPILKTGLTNFPHDFLLKKLATQLYLELCNFFRQLASVINQMLDADGCYSRVEVYEFYRDTQSIEKKLNQFFQFSKQFDPGRKLGSPQQLKVNSNTVYYLEQAAQDERKRGQIRYLSPNADTLSRKKFGQQQQQETIIEEQENYTDQKQQ